MCRGGMGEAHAPLRLAFTGLGVGPPKEVPAGAPPKIDTSWGVEVPREMPAALLFLPLPQTQEAPVAYSGKDGLFCTSAVSRGRFRGMRGVRCCSHLPPVILIFAVTEV